MSDAKELLEDVQTEADLCRNEGAQDIANLLDRVATFITEEHDARVNAERSLSQTVRGRDCYRAILDGMEFRNLDGLSDRVKDAEQWREIGRIAKERILDGQSLLETVLRINSRGALPEAPKEGT